MEYLCGICQKPVSNAHIDVCADCLEEHDLNPRPFDEWPAWAQFAMRNEWGRRKQQRRDHRHEILYGTLEDFEDLADDD